MEKQIYSSYTAEDHMVWTNLYSRMMQMLPEAADATVMEGIKKIGFPSDHIPDFEEVNDSLNRFTDWKIVPLEEMVKDNQFIQMLAEKVYPCRTWIRSNEQFLAEVDEYDLFHDIIGHTPLLIKPTYCNYLTELGKLALAYINNYHALLFLKRVYWHTIQFGLIISDNSLKIYGAHLLSSRAETSYSLSAGVPKYDLHIPTIMDTPYVKGNFQERYFVINNYDDLYNQLGTIRAELEKRIN